MEDIHFLTQLSRVSQREVELALSLYQDPSLLKWILASVEIPEGASRLAISLDHEREGPFMVVTVDGKFVTCLGRGMIADNLSVITRPKLDSLLAKAQDHRYRAEVKAKLTAEEGTRNLLLKVLDSGDRLSREELIAVSAWHPLLQIEFAKSMFLAQERLGERRKTLLSYKKFKPSEHQKLREYWNLFFAVGHLTILVALNGFQPWMEALIQTQEGRPAILSWGCVRQGIAPLALRGAWMVSKIGKPFLGFYKRGLELAESKMQILNALLGLAVLGFGHSKLEAEVRKCLAKYATPNFEGLSGLKLQAAKERYAFTQLVEKLFQDPQQAMDLQYKLGCEYIVRAGKQLPEGSPYKFSQAEEVPKELAMTVSVNLLGDIMNNDEDTLVMFCMLPWLSRARAEDLYLPADCVRHFMVPWRPEASVYLLSVWENYYGRKQPIVAQKEPGRNEPCSCGSGKKYKRCHGA